MSKISTKHSSYQSKIKSSTNNKISKKRQWTKGENPSEVYDYDAFS